MSCDCYCIGSYVDHDNRAVRSFSLVSNLNRHCNIANHNSFDFGCPNSVGASCHNNCHFVLHIAVNATGSAMLVDGIIIVEPVVVIII